MSLEFKKVKNGKISISYAIQKHGKGPNLVILPGALASKWDYTGMDEFFSENDQEMLGTVVTLDFRGRGESELPENTKVGMSVDDHISDLETVLKEEGISEFVLLGHSLGGAFAIKYATQNTDKVKALIVGDYVPFAPPFSRVWREGIEAKLGDFNIHPDLPMLLEEGFEPEGYIQDLAKLQDIPVTLIRGQGEESFLTKANALKMWDSVTHKEIWDSSEGHSVFKDQDIRKRAVDFAVKL